MFPDFGSDKWFKQQQDLTSDTDQDPLVGMKVQGSQIDLPTPLVGRVEQQLRSSDECGKLQGLFLIAEVQRDENPFVVYSTGESQHLVRHVVEKRECTRLMQGWMLAAQLEQCTHKVEG